MILDRHRPFLPWPKEIKLRERAPLEFALRLRGGLTARFDLPDGNVYHTNARSQHRGNKFGKAVKEMFLIVKGDPAISTRWLAQQIEELEIRVGDVRRQRIGARFDSNKLPILVPLEDEEEQEKEQEQEQEEQEQETPEGQEEGEEEEGEEQQEADTGSSPTRQRQDGSGHFPQQTDPQEQTQTAEAQSGPPGNPSQVFRSDDAGEDLFNQQAPGSSTSSETEYNPANDQKLHDECERDANPPPTGTTQSAPATSASGLTCQDLAIFGLSAKKEADEESDNRSCESVEQSTWDRFLDTAKEALQDCRACLWWKTNPSNLGDTLHSIGVTLGKMANGPPAEDPLCNRLPDLEQVIFCVTSFKREQQLKKALPLNLLCLAAHKRFVKVVVVTFGPDQELQRWLRHHLQWALDEGLLKLASGGEASGTASPAELGSWSHRNGRLFESWHASVAKNTSHLVAMTGTNKDLSKTLLINLDNDNLLGNSYLGAVVQTAINCKKTWHGRACPAVCCGTGSLTGRLAYWALDFAAIGGYDQEPGIQPSGLN